MSHNVPRRSPGDLLLRDQLSKETRTERRTLLGVSAIGIVIVKTGLVPAKISALGIEFNQTDQRSLLLAVAAVTIYFLIAFLIYAASDFLLWRTTFSAIQPADKPGELQQVFRGSILLRMYTPLSFLRAFFEFGLPILISLYAIILLIRGRV